MCFVNDYAVEQWQTVFLCVRVINQKQEEYEFHPIKKSGTPGSGPTSGASREATERQTWVLVGEGAILGWRKVMHSGKARSLPTVQRASLNHTL